MCSKLESQLTVPSLFKPNNTVQVFANTVHYGTLYVSPFAWLYIHISSWYVIKTCVKGQRDLGYSVIKMKHWGQIPSAVSRMPIMNGTVGRKVCPTRFFNMPVTTSCLHYSCYGRRLRGCPRVRAPTERFRGVLSNP